MCIFVSKLERIVDPLRLVEEYLKFHAAEHANSREKVAFAPHTDGTPWTPFVQLLVAVPATLSHSVSSEEDFDIENLSLVRLIIRRWLPRRRKCHPDAQDLSVGENGSEIRATKAVIDVLPAVVAMDCQTAALPPRKSERRVRGRDEADCHSCVCSSKGRAAFADSFEFDLEIYRL